MAAKIHKHFFQMLAIKKQYFLMKIKDFYGLSQWIKINMNLHF